MCLCVCECIGHAVLFQLEQPAAAITITHSVYAMYVNAHAHKG